MKDEIRPSSRHVGQRNPPMVGEKIAISNNVGAVKFFASVLTRALRGARHFALVRRSFAAPAYLPLDVAIQPTKHYNQGCSVKGEGEPTESSRSGPLLEK